MQKWCSRGVALGQGDISILGDFPSPTRQGSELLAVALPPALHGARVGLQNSRVPSSLKFTCHSNTRCAMARW